MADYRTWLSYLFRDTSYTPVLDDLPIFGRYRIKDELSQSQTPFLQHVLLSPLFAGACASEKTLVELSFDSPPRFPTRSQAPLEHAKQCRVSHVPSSRLRRQLHAELRTLVENETLLSQSVCKCPNKVRFNQIDEHWAPPPYGLTFPDSFLIWFPGVSRPLLAFDYHYPRVHTGGLAREVRTYSLNPEVRGEILTLLRSNVPYLSTKHGLDTAFWVDDSGCEQVFSVHRNNTKLRTYEVLRSLFGERILSCADSPTCAPVLPWPTSPEDTYLDSPLASYLDPGKCPYVAQTCMFLDKEFPRTIPAVRNLFTHLPKSDCRIPCPDAILWNKEGRVVALVAHCYFWCTHTIASYCETLKRFEEELLRRNLPFYSARANPLFSEVRDRVAALATYKRLWSGSPFGERPKRPDSLAVPMYPQEFSNADMLALLYARASTSRRELDPFFGPYDSLKISWSAGKFPSIKRFLVNRLGRGRAMLVKLRREEGEAALEQARRRRAKRRKGGRGGKRRGQASEEATRNENSKEGED